MSSKGKTSSSSSSSKKSSIGSDQKHVDKIAKEKSEDFFFVGKVINAAKKSDKRIICVGKNRVYFLQQGRGKILNTGHYLDLKVISSTKPDEVSLEFKAFKFNSKTGDADDIIHNVRVAYHLVFGKLDSKLKPKLDINPTSRLRDLPDSASLACGGYAEAYSSVCDYFGVQLRPDIVWDIKNVLGSNNVTEFNIKEFEQPLRPEDQKALLKSLGYNSHFVSLTCKNFKLARDTFTSMADALSQNTSIETLELKSCGMTKDMFLPVCEAIHKNPQSGLTTIQIAKNSVSDQTLATLGKAIGSLKSGVVVLDVSHNQTKNGLAPLFQGFRKNMHMPSTLSRLIISHNVLGSSGSSALAQWLANPNGLQILDIAHTAANLDIVVGAVQRGCQELQQLDISGNKISKKESGTLTRFLQGAGKLKQLTISETGIAPNSLKDIVDALCANYYLQDFSLVAQKNKFGASGGGLIGKALTVSKNIASIDLSENEFGDSGISALCKALHNNTVLKHLGLGGNFTSGSGKGREDALEAIIDLLASECPIESLDIHGTSRSALSTDISTFLYALGTDDSLKTLNVEGNKMSDKGALALSKALQTNRTLESIFLDNNAIGASGFQSLSYGMKRNFTLKQMPLPISDITAGMPRDSSSRSSYQSIINQISGYVRRNQSPQSKFSTQSTVGGMGAASMLITSGEREQLERLRFKIKSTGRKLDQDDIEIIEDAENNDNYIQSIHSIQETHHMAVSDDVIKSLKSFVPQLVPVVEKHQNALLNEVMDFVSKRYQSIDSDTVGRLKRNIQFMGKSMDLSAVEQVIVDAAGDEIKNKVQECFLSAVEITVDYIYEKLGDMLQNVLDDVKTGQVVGDDSSSEESEYEEIEIEVTDSDEDYDDDDYDQQQYADDDSSVSSSSSSASTSSTSSLPSGTPPSDPLLKAAASLPPPVASRPAAKIPAALPPGIGGAPPGRPVRPTRPGRPGMSASSPAPGPPGRPVRPPSLNSSESPIRGGMRGRGGRGGMRGRGRGRGGMRGRGRGRGRGNLGGGIAARLQAMGGGIPMPMMGGGAPPPRSSKPIQTTVITGSQNSAVAPVKKSAPPRVAGRSSASSPASTAGTKSSSGGRTLFGKKKKTKIIRRKVKKSKAGSSSTAAKITSNIKVSKPSGDKSNMAKMQQSTNITKNHMTRARPMIQRKRRPPTRRPRNLAA